jgi:hypothetical protein
MRHRWGHRPPQSTRPAHKPVLHRHPRQGPKQGHLWRTRHRCIQRYPDFESTGRCAGYEAHAQPSRARNATDHQANSRPPHPSKRNITPGWEALRVRVCCGVLWCALSAWCFAHLSGRFSFTVYVWHFLKMRSESCLKKDPIALLLWGFPQIFRWREPTDPL